MEHKIEHKKWCRGFVFVSLWVQGLLDACITFFFFFFLFKNRSIDLHIPFYQILCRRWTKMMLTNKLDVNQRSLLKFTRNASQYSLLPFTQYKKLYSLKTVAYNMTWWKAANHSFLYIFLCRHISKTGFSNYSILLPSTCSRNGIKFLLSFSFFFFLFFLFESVLKIFFTFMF